MLEVNTKVVEVVKMLSKSAGGAVDSGLLQMAASEEKENSQKEITK